MILLKLLSAVNLSIFITAVRRNPCTVPALSVPPNHVIFREFKTTHAPRLPFYFPLCVLCPSVCSSCRLICKEEHGVLSRFRRGSLPAHSWEVPPCSGSVPLTNGREEERSPLGAEQWITLREKTETKVLSVSDSDPKPQTGGGAGKIWSLFEQPVSNIYTETSSDIYF